MSTDVSRVIAILPVERLLPRYTVDAVDAGSQTKQSCVNVSVNVEPVMRSNAQATLLSSAIISVVG